VGSLATPIGKRLVQSEIIVVFSLLLLIIFAYFAWISYGNYTSGMYFSVSDFWNFHWMIVDMFLAGVFSTLFVVFLGFWAHTKMKYLEIERQQLREEIKKELEAERQKKEGTA
jgi:uncharacterized membrane protein